MVAVLHLSSTNDARTFEVGAIATITAALLSAVVALVIWAYPKDAKSENTGSSSSRETETSDGREDTEADRCIVGSWRASRFTFSLTAQDGTVTNMSLVSGYREWHFSPSGIATLRVDYTANGRPATGAYAGKQISLREWGSASRKYQATDNEVTFGESTSVNMNRSFAVDGRVLGTVPEKEAPDHAGTYQCSDKTLDLIMQNGTAKAEYRRIG